MHNSNTNSCSSSDSDWIPCRRGVIAPPQMKLTERVIKRKSDVFSLSLIYLSGAMLACALLLSWQNRPERERAFTSETISCGQVRVNLQSYANHKISSCALRANISKHLCGCPSCDCQYQTLIGNRPYPRATFTEFEVTSLEGSSKNEGEAEKVSLR
jgi:hypothetical protein